VRTLFIHGGIIHLVNTGGLVLYQDNTFVGVRSGHGAVHGLFTLARYKNHQTNT
jgi:hypothetical protein